MIWHDPASKPEPWLWRWEDTWAWWLGLPRPYRFFPIWEGAGSRITDTVAQVAGASGSTALKWAGSTFGMASQHDASNGCRWDLPAGTILAGKTNLSIVALVATTAAAGISGNAIYCERGNSGSDILKIDQASSNVWELVYRDDAGTLNIVSGQAAINDGKPQLLGLSKRGAAITLYQNSRAPKTSTLTATDTFTNTLLPKIGGDPTAGVTNNVFQGAIGAIMLFDQPLPVGAWQVLAAHLFAYHARSPIQFLGALGGTLPPALLAGIGYGYGGGQALLQRAADLGGIGSGAAGLVAALQRAEQLAGRVDGKVVSLGSPTLARNLAGTETGAAGGQALAGGRAVAGRASGSGAGRALAGGRSPQGSASGSGTGRALAGGRSVAGQASGSGPGKALAGGRSPQGAASGSSAGTAIAGGRSLAGTSSGGTSATAALRIERDLRGTVDGYALQSARLEVTRLLAGVGSGHADGRASLRAALTALRRYTGLVALTQERSGAATPRHELGGAAALTHQRTGIAEGNEE